MDYGEFMEPKANGGAGEAAEKRMSSNVECKGNKSWPEEKLGGMARQRWGHGEAKESKQTRGVRTTATVPGRGFDIGWSWPASWPDLLILFHLASSFRFQCFQQAGAQSVARHVPVLHNGVCTAAMGVCL